MHAGDEKGRGRNCKLLVRRKMIVKSSRVDLVVDRRAHGSMEKRPRSFCDLLVGLIALALALTLTPVGHGQSTSRITVRVATSLLILHNNCDEYYTSAHQ